MHLTQSSESGFLQRSNLHIKLLLTIVLLAAVGSTFSLYTSRRQVHLQAGLMEAAEKGNYPAAAKLLDEGVDPDAHYPISFVQKLHYWEDPLPENEPMDTTALVLAAARGHTKIVQLLIAKGANVNTRCHYQAPKLEGQDVRRYTALEVAQRSDIVKLLEQAGAKR